MTTLNIQQLTGLNEREGNQVLLDEYAKRTGAHWWIEEGPSRLPVGILVEFNATQLYDWPSRDLNLMALIVTAMTEEELGRYETVLHGLYGQMKETHPFKYLLWLVTLDAQTRFVAAILTLKLGRN